MSFKEDIQKHVIQVNERKAHITNEETTKHALIVPFLQALGYDVFNPLELKPEYAADFPGNKKGEKVDYALFKDGEPIAFIEAKSVNDSLVNRDGQLSRYFNAIASVKLGIVTNGIVYKFYMDLLMENVMDQQPFYTIDLTSLKDKDIDVLENFKKEKFAKDELFKIAEELMYTNTLKELLKKQFKEPSDDFIRLILKDQVETRVTSNVIDRFRPIVKTAVSSAILDIVGQGLTGLDHKEKKDPPAQVETTPEPADTTDKIITTPEETRTFETIKTILEKAGRDTKDLLSKDTMYYFSINYRNTQGWFLRVKLDGQVKFLVTRLNPELLQNLATGYQTGPAPRGHGESRVSINGYEDINKLGNVVLAAYDDITKIIP